MPTPQKKYEVELWVNDVLIADISHLAKNLKWRKQRNEAESCSFSIDLTAFENFAARINEHPRSLLDSYITDVKIKRNGEYMIGCQVVEVTPSFTTAGGTLDVRCDGYLNLFTDRYVTVEYDEVESTAIAWGMIDTTQGAANGDFGVTLGPNQYVTGADRVRNYVRENVKEELISLTELVSGKFDFEFTYDKKFNTYETLGSDRTDIILTYPGNVASLKAPRSGQTIFNHIEGLGSGFGDETITSTADDAVSQVTYGRRELPLSFNGVSLQDTLDEKTDAELEKRLDILQLPQMTISGAKFDLNDVQLGDRPVLKVMNHPYIDNIDGPYRIEVIDVTTDENEAETITLTFDDFGL